MNKSFFVLFLGLGLVTSCKNLKTTDDLKIAIIGESTASEKYAAFAEKARAEGFDTIAKLFDATSRSESIHAANHLKVLSELDINMEDFKPEYTVKSTLENLKDAIVGESYESTTMYPGFLVDSEDEKMVSATNSFNWALKTEKKHLMFFEKSLDALQKITQNKLSFEFQVCPTCGNTFEAGIPIHFCPFCGTLESTFIKI